MGAGWTRTRLDSQGGRLDSVGRERSPIGTGRDMIGSVCVRSARSVRPEADGCQPFLSPGPLPSMREDDLFTLLDAALKPLGSASSPGEEFASPALDVLRYDRRPVRLNRWPIVGKASSVVAVVRQPVDLPFTVDGTRRLLERTSIAVNGRFPPFPPGHGLAIGLTAIGLTPEPIGPDDESVLEQALSIRPRLRALPLGILRVNLGQEGMAMALTRGPDGLFRFEVLVESPSEHFLEGFVPLFDIE